MIQATLPRQAAPAIDLNQLAKQALQPWADAYESWRSGVADLVRPVSKTQATKGCGCPSCQSDPCLCRCCVADADLVIEARVGERRIIPVTIENPWRRERDIELELSSWTTIQQPTTVTGNILTPLAVKLAPCGEAKVVLQITVGGGEGDPATGGDQQQGPPADVDRCLVSYADLRIKGCDLRSIRIAVAVLPRTCDAHIVNCACGCC